MNFIDIHVPVSDIYMYVCRHAYMCAFCAREPTNNIAVFFVVLFCAFIIYALLFMYAKR